MWPLRGQDLVDITQGNCTFSQLESTLITSASTDSRKIEPSSLFVAIKGEYFDGHAFISSALENGAILALASADWEGWNTLSDDKKSRVIRVQNVTQAFRQIAATFRRRFPFPVVGIGGSNGKTTTKEMLFALLQDANRSATKTAKSENGFLGLAVTLTQKKHNTQAPPQALVLEIGIDDKDAMQEHIEVGSPDIVLLTHLGPEHLAGLGTWENAVKEEYKLFSLSPSAKRIWQCSDDKLMEMFADVRSGDVLVGKSQRLDEVFKKHKRDESILIEKKGVSILSYKALESTSSFSRISVTWKASHQSHLVSNIRTTQFEIPMPGQHNIENFILACGAALSLGRTFAEIQESWRNFVPPDMRSKIFCHEKFIIFDDCYNASPSSMDAALAVLSTPEWDNKKKIAILGDMLDLGEESKKWHQDLATKLLKAPSLDLCLYGDAMYDVYQHLRQKLNNVTDGEKLLIHKGSKEDPREFLQQLGNLKDCVILVKGSRGMGLERVTKALSEL